MHIAKAGFFNKLEPSLRSQLKNDKLYGKHDFHLLIDKNPPTPEQIEKITEKDFEIESTFDDIITGQTHVQNLENIATLDFIRLIALKNELEV